MFPIAIHASTEAARTDWRCDPSALRYELVSVPDAVAEGVSRYMHRTTLAYAGFDFVVTPEGQWVMLEAATGAAMATMLAKGVM